MCLTFDVSFIELWHHICHAGYWLFPIIGVWGVIYFINALSWQAIIKSNTSEGEHVSLLRIYRLTITGYALNNVTPVGGLGGEPYRIVELTRHMTKDHASSSVILYAMMHIYSHFWYWFTSVFLYIALWLCGDTLLMNKVVVGCLLTICAFCLLGFYFFSKGYKNGMVVKVLQLIGKIPGLKNWSHRFIAKHQETLDKIDSQIAALHKQDKKAFYTSLLLEYFGRVMQGFEIMFIMLLFGEDCGGGPLGLTVLFLHCVLIQALTSLLANLIGFLPMQLGVQEGGYVASIAALGLRPEIGIFTSIIARVRQLVWDFIGVTMIRINNN
ncbi:MAG: flippase-like domain-containing protein [Bacteroidaceae bacterium]|nr:flippase-like domain-containing protein [Bacteroidaceae bacterium]